MGLWYGQCEMACGCITRNTTRRLHMANQGSNSHWYINSRKNPGWSVRRKMVTKINDFKTWKIKKDLRRRKNQFYRLHDYFPIRSTYNLYSWGSLYFIFWIRIPQKNNRPSFYPFKLVRLLIQNLRTISINLEIKYIELMVRGYTTYKVEFRGNFI